MVDFRNCSYVLTLHDGCNFKEECFLLNEYRIKKLILLKPQSRQTVSGGSRAVPFNRGFIVGFSSPTKPYLLAAVLLESDGCT